MVNGSAESLAQSYLDKHKTPDHLVGLGPVLGNGIGLYAAPSAMVDGSLIIEFDPTSYVDCRIIAQRLCADILSQNPELKPRVVMQDGRIQNWVEITDPQTGGTIQIDATPWYGRLNPGLVGKESNEVPVIDHGEVKKGSGPILSVKRMDTGVITVTLVGFLPKVGIGAKLQEVRRRMENADAQEEPKPEYTFTLSAIFRRGFMPAEPEFGVNLYIDVMDSANLQRCIQSALSIEDLVDAKAIQIALCASIGMESKGNAISLANESSELRELIFEIKRDLSGMIVLLEQATPSLQVYRYSEQIDVKDGDVHFSNRSNASDYLTMKGDYAAFMKYKKQPDKPVFDMIKPMPIRRG
jgi:hypothetical protein